MKESTWTRGILYFSIAAIAALITDISKYKHFSDIEPVSLVILVSNLILQGLIAVRAFLDQSVSRAVERKSKVQLLTENKTSPN